MNKLNNEKRAQIIALLCEGNSMRSVTRLTGVSINTVTKLLVDLGAACSAYQDKVFVNLKCQRIQCDEIWSFCYAKAKNVKGAVAAPEGAGDVWTWTAIDADTKLIPCWYIGTRDAGAAYHFIYDLKHRLANRVQLTTDGHGAYLSAIADAFGDKIDYAQLQKIYGKAPEGAQVRYSPAQCMGARKAVIKGVPSAEHVSTSYVERQNLNIRMSNRRFTRLTNAFSKKVENHEHAFAITMMFHNFCRIHKTLRCTPAMEAGITDHIWEITEVVALLDAAPAKAA
jgi:IS1 family transposase